MGIAIAAGTATVYAGLPEASSHRQLASLGAGQSYVITGLAAGEVVSVQSGGAFSYVLTMPAAAPSPTPTPVAACADPARCATLSHQCSLSGAAMRLAAQLADWVGVVIAWPSWSAYSTADASLRFDIREPCTSAQGEVLYPYMGSWASGCQVTAVAGVVLIIEWQRGTEVWRETYLDPGETHTDHAHVTRRWRHDRRPGLLTRV